MLYKYNDIVKIEGNVRKARAAINSKYIKVAPGIYSTDETNYVDHLVVFFIRYKTLTITMQTAFEYYDFTDINYEKYTLAFIQGYRKINNPLIKQSYINSDIYYLGREKINKDGFDLYIYNRERLLIELIRNKAKLPYDYYKEIVNSYRTLVKEDEINLSKVIDYCQHFNHSEKLIQLIQEIILWHLKRRLD